MYKFLFKPNARPLNSSEHWSKFFGLAPSPSELSETLSTMDVSVLSQCRAALNDLFWRCLSEASAWRTDPVRAAGGLWTIEGFLRLVSKKRLQDEMGLLSLTFGVKNGGPLVADLVDTITEILASVDAHRDLVASACAALAAIATSSAAHLENPLLLYAQPRLADAALALIPAVARALPGPVTPADGPQAAMLADAATFLVVSLSANAGVDHAVLAAPDPVVTALVDLVHRCGCLALASVRLGAAPAGSLLERLWSAVAGPAEPTLELDHTLAAVSLLLLHAVLRACPDRYAAHASPGTLHKLLANFAALGSHVFVFQKRLAEDRLAPLAQLCLGVWHQVVLRQSGLALLHTAGPALPITLLHRDPLTLHISRLEVTSPPYPAGLCLDACATYAASHLTASHFRADLVIRGLDVLARLVAHVSSAPSAAAVAYTPSQWRRVWQTSFKAMRFACSSLAPDGSPAAADPQVQAQAVAVCEASARVLGAALAGDDQGPEWRAVLEGALYEVTRESAVLAKAAARAELLPETSSLRRKASSALANLIAAAAHVHARVDEWAVAQPLGEVVTEEDVKNVIAANLVRYAVPSQGGSGDSEVVGDDPKEQSFFNSVIRQTIVDFRDRPRTI